MRAWALVVVIAAQGCNDCSLNRMIDQPRYESYEACEVCPNGTSMLMPPDGTIARDVQLGVQPQPPIDRALVLRGRNRFEIFCAACHGRLGDGKSQVAQNMLLRKPPDLTEPKYAAFTRQKLFVTITNGYGLMRSYAGELPVEDRWAVVSYVQVLQLARRATLSELPAQIKQEGAPWLK